MVRSPDPAKTAGSHIFRKFSFEELLENPRKEAEINTNYHGIVHNIYIILYFCKILFSRACDDAGR